MLVINGFFESGKFIPEKPLDDIKGRQKAVLHIVDDNDKQERLSAWKEFSQAIKNSDEVLEGEPERMRFRTAEEIAVL
jgi:hypothetical protein